MSALIMERDPLIPLQHACAALAMPRATLYRHLKPKTQARATTRGCNGRRLSEAERQAVLDVLHEPRFAEDTCFHVTHNGERSSTGFFDRAGSTRRSLYSRRLRVYVKRNRLLSLNGKYGNMPSLRGTCGAEIWS